MKDNEIIKALKCCGRYHNEGRNDTHCRECQFKSYAPCVAFLCDRTIDLINRQKAEIERLQKTRKPTETSGFKLENGKIVFYVDLLGKYSHEFKDLNEVVEELNLMLAECYKTDEIAGYLKSLQEQHKTARAEAIEELAKRLKDRVVKKYKYTDIRVFNELDNLVKEMVGDAE